MLKLFKSYLSDSSHHIKIVSTVSDSEKLMFSVFQSLVHSAILFSLYTTSLSKTIFGHPHIKFHFLANDTWLYISISQSQKCSISF